MEKELGILVSKLQGIAQTGKTYCKDPYDLERYQELQQVTSQLIRTLYSMEEEQLHIYMEKDEGYATPKVDVRAVVFDRQNRLLLVREKSDGGWALPGGWADIGYSPMEIAQKETWEEAGIKVQGQRLIAVLDKAKHDYPPSLTYTYKFFIDCAFVEGDVSPGLETSQAAFFTREAAASLFLSQERNTKTDLEMLFADHLEKGSRPVICD